MKKLSCFWNPHDWPSFSREDGGLLGLCKGRDFTLSILPIVDRVHTTRVDITYTSLKGSIYE